MLVRVLSFLVLVLVAGCERKGVIGPEESDTKGGLQMEITSSAFMSGGTIPTQYTGEGVDVSPPLSWEGAPEGVKSFAIICDDPDAPVGTWVHWVIYNIPADKSSLSEKVESDKVLRDGSLQGVNDFGRIGYDGPMPPRGPAHRYFFRLYALDAVLELDSGATKSDLLDAMEGHVLDEAELVGIYQR